MFVGITQLVGGPIQSKDTTPREVLPPTPVKFPQCVPKSEGKPSKASTRSMADLLQTIHRPADINLSHFEALGIHVIPDASQQDLIPDPSYLPPTSEWNAIPDEKLSEANERTRKPLNNGNLSPGIQTYRERQKELLIDNTSAFRTIRRIPNPAGSTPARLGNAYEFYKNLEFFSGYWQDTSLPPKSDDEKKEIDTPTHLKTHVLIGTGTQLPPEYRQHLLSAFIKLVAYDFGCNVSFPRTEPRLHVTPKAPKAPSYFNSSVTFIYRIPTERSLARSGIVEGPVAALSSRNTTVFATPAEETLDLAREVVAVLLTAQQRAREKKTEERFGEGKWWATKPRWGGGPGGPIGREGDVIEVMQNPPPITTTITDPAEAITSRPVEGSDAGSKVAAEVKRAIGGINGPSPNKRSSKKTKDNGQLPMYAAYRKMAPPGPTWDKRAKYMAIGKVKGSEYDDVFLVSCLNHHVSVLRARVPDVDLRVLDSEEGDWEGVKIWRSRWWDMFKAEERIEGMGVVWGMMGWLMRKVEGKEEKVGEAEQGEKMDTT